MKLCGHCKIEPVEPSRPGEPEKSRCLLCRPTCNILQRSRRAKRIAAGKCNYCNADPLPGLMMCSRHRDYYADQRRKAKMKNDTSR